MKSIKNITGFIGLFLAGFVLFSSCVRRDDDYNSYPNNNNNNGYSNHTYDSSYYNERFNGVDNSIWTFTDPTDSAYTSIAGDSFEYVDYSTTLSNMVVVNTGVNTQGNFTISARIKSNNIMGLIFGASTSSNGYAFYIDTAGNYSLYQEGYGGTASTMIIPSTQDSLYALKKNWNVLEVDQTNGTWTGFINGTEVFSISARTISGSSFGFRVLPETIGFASYLTAKND